MQNADTRQGSAAEFTPTVRLLRTGKGPRGGVVTREAVFEVAEALEAKLGRVTAHLVRDVLGGGSFTPIAEHLRAYRQAKLKAASASADELLTAPLREAFVVAFGNAQAEARKEFAAELAVAEEEREEASAAVAELEADRARLQAQVDELEVTVAELREEAVHRETAHRERDRERDGVVASLTHDRDEARRVAQEQQSKVASLEVARKQASAYADMQDAERRRALDALEAERRARADADKVLAVAEARAVAHKEASDRVERELERTREGVEELRASVEGLRESQRASEQAAHKLALENAAITASLEAERERAAHREERRTLSSVEVQRARDPKSRRAKEVAQ